MADADKGMLIGGNGQSGRSHTLRLTVMVLSLLVVLAAAAGVGIYLYGHQKHTAASSDGTPSKKTSLPQVKVSYVQMSNDDLTTKVHYLVGTGQYDDAEKLITTQKDYKSDSVKLGLLLSVQNAAKDTTAAAQTNTQIASLPGLSPAQYEAVANQYASASDKTRALDYFNKALAAYKARNIGSDPDSVVRVQARIKELQQ